MNDAIPFPGGAGSPSVWTPKPHPAIAPTAEIRDRRSRQGRLRPALVRWSILWTLLVSCGFVRAGMPTGEMQPLFDAETFPKGWSFYSAEKEARLQDTWKVIASRENEPPVLVCLGKPFGYIRTTKEYENFQFGLEWKYLKDPNGNSGVLLHTNGEDTIWPKSIQIQLHRPTAGSIFPSPGARTENTLEVKDVQLAVDQWHKCVITSRDGRISVSINGNKVGEVTGCEPRKGSIALQSEGSRIHFRNVWVREINSGEAPADD